MKPLIFIAAFSLVSLSAQARLGETPTQIEARYGKPMATAMPTPAIPGTAKRPITAQPRIIRTNEYELDYTHAGYGVTVTFWNGKSAQERIRSRSVMDEETVSALFKNVSGKEPVKVEKSGGTSDASVFYKADGVEGFTSGSQNLNVKSYTLTIRSSDYAEHVSDILAAEKKKKLDSF